MQILDLKKNLFFPPFFSLSIFLGSLSVCLHLSLSSSLFLGTIVEAWYWNKCDFLVLSLNFVFFFPGRPLNIVFMNFERVWEIYWKEVRSFFARLWMYVWVYSCILIGFMYILKLLMFFYSLFKLNTKDIFIYLVLNIFLLYHILFFQELLYTCICVMVSVS